MKKTILILVLILNIGCKDKKVENQFQKEMLQKELKYNGVTVHHKKLGDIHIKGKKTLKYQAYLKGKLKKETLFIDIEKIFPISTKKNKTYYIAPYAIFSETHNTYWEIGLFSYNKRKEENEHIKSITLGDKIKIYNSSFEKLSNNKIKIFYGKYGKHQKISEEPDEFTSFIWEI